MKEGNDKKSSSTGMTTSPASLSSSSPASSSRSPSKNGKKQDGDVVVAREKKEDGLVVSEAPVMGQVRSRRRSLYDSGRLAFPSIGRESISIVAGFQARMGLCILLFSFAGLVRYSKSGCLSGVLSRLLGGEGMVQLFFALFLKTTTTVLTPYHVMLTGLFSFFLFYYFPMEEMNLDSYVLILALVCIPLGLSMLWYGVLDSQMKHHMSSSYWTFAFETNNNNGRTNKFRPGNFAVLHSSPASVIAVLSFTQFMVQMLEIGGMDDVDRQILVQARNQFLFRARNSGSLRHRAIASEILFRVTAEILMKRTAMQMVKPAGPVSTTLSFMEKQFSDRLLDHSEVFIKPLPSPFDPDSTFKLILITVSTLLGHKRLFKMIKGHQGGKLHPTLQATKYISRFGILVYLTSRYLIIHGKRHNNNLNNSDASAVQYLSSIDGDTNGLTPPRMYN